MAAAPCVSFACVLLSVRQILHLGWRPGSVGGRVSNPFLTPTNHQQMPHVTNAAARCCSDHQRCTNATANVVVYSKTTVTGSMECSVGNMVSFAAVHATSLSARRVCGDTILGRFVSRLSSSRSRSLHNQHSTSHCALS